MGHQSDHGRQLSCCNGVFFSGTGIEVEPRRLCLPEHTQDVVLMDHIHSLANEQRCTLEALALHERQQNVLHVDAQAWRLAGSTRQCNVGMECVT